MGHKQVDKFSVQKAHLKTLLTSMIIVSNNIMRFQITLTDKEEEIKGLKSLIKEGEKAIEIINSVVHYEILVSLYNSFFANKESYFATLVRTITKGNIKRWDRTKKGFNEFVLLEQEARAKSKKELEEKMKLQEEIKKAKEEGKKIEMVFENGKLQPRIVSEKSN